MAADGSVVIEILGDAKDITSKLQSVSSGAVSGLKAAFSGVATAVTATTAAVGAASGAVGAFAKKSLDAYGNYEQLVGGVETLFQDLDYDIIQNANKAYKTAGLSANEYMETVMGFAASLNQSLESSEGNIARAADVADQTIIDMSDNANKMGTSMESIQNAYQGFAKQNYTINLMSAA